MSENSLLPHAAAHVSQEIADMELKLLDIDKQVHQYESEQKTIELAIKKSIDEATDEEGKKRYSNETKRGYEASRRLSINSRYQELRTLINELHAASKKGMIKLSHLKRTFRVHEMISRAQTQ